MDNKKYILPFSAKSKEALENTSIQIIDFLKANNNISLANASWTLQSGRRAYNYRKIILASRDDFQNNLLQEHASAITAEASKNVVFVFPDTNDLSAWWQLTEENHNYNIVQLFNDSMAVILDRLPAALAKAVRSSELYDKRVSCYQAYINGYASNRVLTVLGVNPTAYIGAGISELTAMTCSGALDIDNAIDIIERYGKMETYQTVYQNYDIKPRQVPIMRSSSKKARQHIEQSVVIKLGTHQLSNHVLEGCLDQSSEVIHLFEAGYKNLSEHLYHLISYVWCKGIDIKWAKVSGNKNTRRVILPTYVFDKVPFDSDVPEGSTHSANKSPICNTVINDKIRKDTPIEELRKFWSEAVGKQDIYDNDDFFQIGGDSLSAIMLSSKIREQLNIEISLSDMFANSTFKKMSKLVEGSFKDVDDNEIILLDRREYYETSSAQKRMFAINEFVEEGVPYNFADVYHVNGKVDKEKLSNAFQILVDRHEVFRTRFDMVNGEVVQRIEDVLDFKINFISCSQADLKTNIDDSIKPFNLYEAPLMRVKVIHIGNEEHVIVIDMHHIIADQTSLSILINEISLIYQNMPLTKLEIQYKDFAHWQNNYFRSGKLDSQIAYWKNEFKNGIPCLTLQTDYNRPEIMQYQGDKVTYEFGEELSKKVHSASATYGITPYMIMLAALNILLWKYTKQKNIVIGTAIAGRKHSKLASTVGMFVNTLVIHAEIDGQSTINEFIQYIREKMLGAYDNQDFQFDMLVEALDPPKNLSRNVLFDVFLNYVNVGSEHVEIDGNIWLPYEKDEIGIKQDIGFIIEENDNGFMLDIEYSKALYMRETIELMCERFILVLSDIIHGRNERIDEISIMSEVEKNWILNVVNRTQTDAPLDKHVIHLFESCVCDKPDAIAIEWLDQKITYEQLNNLVNQMANLLVQQQVAYRDIVPILLDWGVMQIVSILSIMKVGAAYLPIDPTYPQERIDFIIQDSASKVIITDSLEHGKIGCSIRKFMVDAEENVLDSSLNTGLTSPHTPAELDPDDICYVIYTSGSTGRPKGTRIKHKNVIRTVKDTNYVNVESSDRVIQISNYVFDASVMNIFLSLLNQACLIVIPRSLSIEIASLAQFIKEQNITVFALPTALFHLIVDWNVNSLKNVKRIIVGGEQMSLSHTKKALEIMGAEKLVNGYGPTESTVIATYYLINDLNDRDIVPIGYPVSNTSIYVVDEDKNLSPIGIPGELYIGGDGLGAGYLNRPELTEDKFSPLQIANSQMTYATGDIVMWNSKKELIFVGRKDFQLKINGYRVELEEVERYIETINGIKKAVVIAQTDHMSNLYLKAYCVLDDFNQYDYFDEEYIRTSLRNKLPEYMVPYEYVILQEFPLNHNGKIDKKALSNMEVKHDSLHKAGDSKTNLESVILNAMKRALNSQNIGSKDNFFEIGGQSIRAIAMAKDLMGEGVEIKVNDIFQYQTAEKLAMHLKKFNSKDIVETKEERHNEIDYTRLNDSQIDILISMALTKQRSISEFIGRTSNTVKFPLSPIQDGHHQRGSGFSGVLIEVEGVYSENQMKDAITQVILDNQILRCVLIAEKEVLQWSEHSGDGFHAISRVSYGYVDLSIYQNDTNIKIINKLSHNIFTLEYGEGELRWNLCILKRQEDNHLIIWGLDHLIFDGMSAEILKGQVLANLDREAEEYTQPIRQYSDYVELLQAGPLDLKSQEIIEKFNLLTWCKLNNEIILKQQDDRNGASSKCITMEISLNNVKNSNIWQYAINLIAGVFKGYFGMHLIPFVMVDYGREYAGESFYNTVGEFLDLIPVMSDSIEKVSDGNIFQYCKKFSLNFLSMLSQEDVDGTYSEVLQLIRKDFYGDSSYFNFILLNFQGFISKADESVFSQISDDSDLARTVVTIHYDKDKLYFEIDDVSGLDKEKITRILKEKIEELGR